MAHCERCQDYRKWIQLLFIAFALCVCVYFTKYANMIDLPRDLPIPKQKKRNGFRSTKTLWPSLETPYGKAINYCGSREKRGSHNIRSYRCGNQNFLIILFFMHACMHEPTKLIAKNIVNLFRVFVALFLLVFLFFFLSFNSSFVALFASKIVRLVYFERLHFDLLFTAYFVAITHTHALLYTFYCSWTFTTIPLTLRLISFKLIIYFAEAENRSRWLWLHQNA